MGMFATNRLLPLLVFLCLFAGSSANARFLQADPVGYKADLDLYTYAHNDPTNQADPSGLEPDWAWREAAEDEAYRDCGDWGRVNSHMQEFNAQEQQRAQIQGEALSAYASIATGAEALEGVGIGVQAIRGFFQNGGASAAFREAFAGGRHAGMLETWLADPSRKFAMPPRVTLGRSQNIRKNLLTRKDLPRTGAK